MEKSSTGDWLAESKATNLGAEKPSPGLSDTLGPLELVLASIRNTGKFLYKV